MSDRSLAPLRWFGAADVARAMPALEERLRLAEKTMVALAEPGASELPPKVAIHPRPAAAFAHAMPAQLRAPVATDDLVGMKWVAGYATNTALGLPSISAIVVLNDPETGLPMAMLDGAPITAERTAAVSGVALRHFGQPGKPHDVAMLGAGVQGHSHVPIIGAVLPGATLHVFDRHVDRATELVALAQATDGFAGARTHDSAQSAVEASDVVISAASFGPTEATQSMTNAWLRPDSTVVPIDYATYCAAEVARDAALFLVDQREQFLANREAGNFDGYPDPTATLGEAILARTPRPNGRVVISHLGVGLADLVFGDAIVRAATELGLGTTLPR